jgi:hypothetical protein
MAETVEDPQVVNSNGADDPAADQETVEAAVRTLGVLVAPRYTDIKVGGEQQPHKNVLNLWGTVKGDWQGAIKSFLAERGIGADSIFDPELPEGEHYTVTNTQNEVAAMHENGIDLFEIGADSNGYISNLEAAAAAVKAVVDGTPAYIRIEALADEAPNTVVIARTLVTFAAQHVSDLLNADNLAVEPNAQAGIDLENNVGLRDWLDATARQLSGAERPVAKGSSEVETRLEKRIFVAGSAMAREQWPVKNEVLDQLEDTTVVDSFDYDGNFTLDDLAAEFAERARSAVQIDIIGDRTPSRAAIAAVVWNALLAHMQGQRYGLLIEQPAPDSPLEPDALKLRRSLRMHLDEINKRYPGLVYEANSPGDLATWARHELDQYQPLVVA